LALTDIILNRAAILLLSDRDRDYLIALRDKIREEVANREELNRALLPFLEPAAAKEPTP
jgi:hypothetical protein